MKPVIPHDASSTALATDADSDREDQSLHDEILTRLRDHIVEGNIPDGGRVPERELCAMLGMTPNSPRLSGYITRCMDFTCTAICTAISASIS